MNKMHESRITQRKQTTVVKAVIVRDKCTTSHKVAKGNPQYAASRNLRKKDECCMSNPPILCLWPEA